MSEVPTLHIRNVPVEVYEALRRRAGRFRRSLNAEVIETLRISVEDTAERERLLEELDDLRREFLLPKDAPAPEDVIREAREERERELERRTRGL
jgi:plasmid stability protein